MSCVAGAREVNFVMQRPCFVLGFHGRGQGINSLSKSVPDRTRSIDWEMLSSVENGGMVREILDTFLVSMCLVLKRVTLFFVHGTCGERRREIGLRVYAVSETRYLAVPDQEFRSNELFFGRLWSFVHFCCVPTFFDWSNEQLFRFWSTRHGFSSKTRELKVQFENTPTHVRHDDQWRKS